MSPSLREHYSCIPLFSSGRLFWDIIDFMTCIVVCTKPGPFWGNLLLSYFSEGRESLLARLKHQQNPAIIPCGLKRESVSCFPEGTSVLRNYYNITQSPLCGRLLWDVIPDSAHCSSPDWLAVQEKMGAASLPGNSSCSSMKIRSSGRIHQERARCMAIILLPNSKHCAWLNHLWSSSKWNVLVPEVLLTHQQAGNTIKEKKVRAARTNCGFRVCIQMLLMDSSALQLLSGHTGSLAGQGQRFET